QDTCLSPAEVEPARTGNDCLVQARPFHLSARLSPTVLTWNPPTASQKLAVGHDTPSGSGAAAGTVPLAGFGVLCRRQDLPFHLSASVTLIPEVSRLVPTAVHAFAEKQETESICPLETVALGD